MRVSTKPAPAPDYQGALLKVKSEVMSNLGMKFDTIASMGRINEEDQAQMSHDEFLQLRLNAIEYSKLRQLDEALHRLSEGDYGICLACEEPIPPRRLQVIPWAKYCVHCQDLVGNTESQEEDPSAIFAHFALRTH